MKCDPTPGPSSPIQVPVSTPMSLSGSLVNVTRSWSASSVVGRSSLETGAKFIGTSKEPSKSSPSTLKRRIWPTSLEVSEEDVIHLSPILFDKLVNGAPKATSESQTVTVEMKSVSAAMDVTITNLSATAPTEMISQTTETDRMITKLPPTAVEVNNQASETDRMITKFPPTPVEVNNQASETDSRITNIPASKPEMKSAYTETDITITQSPDGKVTETVNTFQCSSMQTEEVQNKDVEDKITQTEVNDSNILTVKKIEIVYSMESWGTQTDVTELENMLPICQRNEPQDERETTLSTDYSHVGDRNQGNLNDEAQSNSGVSEEHNEEVEVDTMSGMNLIISQEILTVMILKMTITMKVKFLLNLFPMQLPKLLCLKQVTITMVHLLHLMKMK